MTTPHINYALAYYCYYGPELVDDTLKVFLTNGTSQIKIDEIIPPQELMQWEYRSIPIPTGFTLTNTLQLKVLIADYSPNVNVTEAMFDWFYVTDYDATGIDEVIEKLNFYPNPVNNFLNYENIDLQFSVELFNAMGKRALTEQVSNKTGQLNCESLAPGIYILKNGPNTFKFLKN
jgi:hypothetical protein